MVQFNPQDPQVQDPNYLFWSRPIEQPKANLGTAKLLEGAAGAVREAAPAGIQIAEDFIRGDVRPQAEEITDTFVQRMSAANAATTGQSGAYDVLTGSKTDDKNPEELKGLPSRVDKLLSARANGKVSPSAYDAQIYSLAKQMRAKYPSFRDFVDGEIYKATGVHPANQLVRGLIQDYNQGQQNLLAGGQHLETLAMSSMWYPGVQQAYQYWRLDPTDPGRQESLRSAVMRAKGYDESLRVNNLQLENSNKRLENTEKITTNNATKAAMSLAADGVSPMMLPIDRPETFDQMMEGIKNGTEPPPNEEESNKISTWLGIQKAQAGQLIESQLTKNFPDLPAEKRKQIIESALQVYDTRLDMLNNQQHGLGSYFDRALKHREIDEGYKWAETDAGRMAMRASAIMKLYGKDSPAAQTMLSLVMGDLQAGAKDFVLQQMGRVAGGETTIKGTWEDWASHGIGGTSVPGVGNVPQSIHESVTAAKLYSNFFSGWYHMLTDKSSPETAKVKAAEKLYDPENRDMFDQFEHNAIKPNGQVTRGSEWMFAQAYGGTAWKEIRTKHPEQAENFRNNAEFQGMSLVKDSLAQLNQQVAEMPPGSLMWDSERHEFIVRSLAEPNRFKRTPGLPVRQPEENPLESAAVKIARPAINNVNTIFRTLEASIYEGEDPDGRIMEYLTDSNTPIAKQMIALIAGARQKQEQAAKQNANQQ